MADVNEYFKDKYEDEQNEFERKLRKHKMSILYRVLLLVAIIVVALIFLYYSYQNKVYSGYDVVKTLEYNESATAHYLGFNGNVLRYSQDGASAFNMSNDMIWNETYEMQSPLADVCGDFVAIGEYKGTMIYVFDSTGLRGKIDTTIPLKSFCVSGNGYVAAILEEDEITWIKLYDKDGVNIANDRTTMAKSGYPVAIDLSDDGILLGVSYLYIDSGILSSSVAYYNFGAVGQNEIDNLVSGYDYPETLVSGIKFMNNKSQFAVGDNKLVIFEGDQKPQSIFETDIEDEIQSVFSNEEYIGLVYRNEDISNRFRIDVYDTKGEIVISQPFNIEYTDIMFNKDTMVIHNATECEIYSLGGLKKFSGTFENSAITLIPTKGKSRFLLVSGNMMEEIQLQ